MTAETAPLPAWKPLRWVGMIALAVALQVALIFWLSDRTPLRQRHPNYAPPLVLAPNFAPAQLALEDPTVFALPSTNGFSGPAWLNKIPSPPQPSEWSAEPGWLPLNPQQLVVSLRLAPANLLPPASVLAGFQPDPSLPARPDEPLFPTNSTFTITGELARRQLLTTLHLPSWPNSDLLANSVLLLMVDPSGRPASVNLLSSSGSQLADEYALNHARTLRFSPVPQAAPPSTPLPARMSWGNLVFSWQTLPQPETNAVAPKL